MCDITAGNVVRINGNRRRFLVVYVAELVAGIKEARLVALSGGAAGCGPTGVDIAKLTHDENQDATMDGASLVYLQYRLKKAKDTAAWIGRMYPGSIISALT